MWELARSLTKTNSFLVKDFIPGNPEVLMRVRHGCSQAGHFLMNSDSLTVFGDVGFMADNHCRLRETTRPE